jgi:hypothetical protein
VAELVGLYADVTTTRDWIDSQGSQRAFPGQIDGRF